MNMNEQHKAIMERFKTMINENDKVLAEEIIASDAEFALEHMTTANYIDN